MEIKKVANLSKDEFEKLVAAGNVLKSIANGLNTKEIDDLNEENKELVYALYGVISEVSKIIIPAKDASK